MGLGFVRGFGLQRGAMASTIAHDAHNIVVVGVSDDDMARAVQRLAELGGGLVVIADMGVQAELPLPVAGLLSVEPYEEVVRETEACVAAVRELGCTFPSPFQMMAFLEDHRPRAHRRRRVRSFASPRRLRRSPASSAGEVHSPYDPGPLV